MTPITIGSLFLASLAFVKANDNTSCTPPAGEVGAVFAMSNAVDNEVFSFSRNDAGELTQTGRYPTGGHGQGVDFDSQGGLTLDSQHQYLYAVNPASDSVTVFAVHGSCLEVVQNIYAGDQPIAITLSGNGFAYVLDGSVASTGIFGFNVDQSNGQLSPLTNQTVPTSTPIGVPGTVVFSPDGNSIVVTNKVGSTLDIFAVDDQGSVGAGPVTISASSGLRPFGAIFNNESTLFVVESGLPVLGNAAVSTYRLNGDQVPSLTPLTQSAKNGQTDGCWIIVTPDSKYAYTASFVTSAISSFSVWQDGTVSLIDGVAGSPGNMSEPVDLAMSSDGRFLYNLLRGTGAVAGWGIQGDGSLKSVGGLNGQGMGLPNNDGASGLAAF